MLFLYIAEKLHMTIILRGRFVLWYGSVSFNVDGPPECSIRSVCWRVLEPLAIVWICYFCYLVTIFLHILCLFTFFCDTQRYMYKQLGDIYTFIGGLSMLDDWFTLTFEGRWRPRRITEATSAKALSKFWWSFNWVTIHNNLPWDSENANGCSRDDVDCCIQLLVLCVVRFLRANVKSLTLLCSTSRQDWQIVSEYFWSFNWVTLHNNLRGERKCKWMIQGSM